MADQIVEFFNKLGQADPVGIFTAILILCVVAGCLALVFRSMGKRGLLVVVAVLLFLFVLTPVVAWWWKR